MNIYYQLFKKLPEIDYINKVATLFGIHDLDVHYNFTLKDLEKTNIIEKIEAIRSELSEYYLNCKFRKYVSDLTEKKCITILRHFLKVINYKVISREKYSDNKKYLVYNIKNGYKTPEKYHLVMSFD